MKSIFFLIWFGLHAMIAAENDSNCLGGIFGLQPSESHCKLTPLLKISFHLQFCCNSSDFIDQGVRFEYDDTTTDRRWQPIKFYTTTVNEHENGTVFLNADGKSVTASAERYDSTLPLQIVNSSQLIRVSEFLCGFNYSSSDIRLRWMQRYTSVTPQLGIATWSLDNITVTIWNGSCKWTSFKETFENESNRSSILHGGIIQSQDNNILYFDQFSPNSPRRSLIIKNLDFINSNSCINEIDETISTESCSGFNINSECTIGAVNCSLMCKPGYRPKGLSCQDIDECMEQSHNCHYSAICKNTIGAFSCSCPFGKILDAQNKCKTQSEVLKCDGDYWNASLYDCCVLDVNGYYYAFHSDTASQKQCHKCKVFGWLQDTYRNFESINLHRLELGYRKGECDMDMDITFDVIPVDGPGDTGATLSKDYEVLNQVVLLNHPIYIRFIADQIALETNETLEIHLRPRSEAQLPEGLFCSTINLIIYDSDTVDMYFSQELYEAKENERLEVRLEKSKRIARPVSLRVTPMSVDDIVPAHLLNATSQSVCPYSCSCDCSINIVSDDDDMELEGIPINIPQYDPYSPNRATKQEDFIGDTVLATFYADDSSEDPQTEALAYINIVDDNINEASQVFILKLDYEDNQFISDIFLNKRHLSLAKIQDNDRIRIGFSNTVYRILESKMASNLPKIIKEDNRSTEQTFFVSIVARTYSDEYYFSATTSEGDNCSRKDLSLNEHLDRINISPDLEEYSVYLSIQDDSFAEGNETFYLSLLKHPSSPTFDFPIRSFTASEIIIIDNDDIVIGFEKNYTIISESNKSVLVCLCYQNPDFHKESEIRFEIEVIVNITNGTANTVEDFNSPTSKALSIMINEKYPHRCISLNITQDTVQESQEYFTVNITRAEIVNTPKYNQIMMIKLEPASTVVFIEDDDIIFIGFTPDEEGIINEKNKVITISIKISGAQISSPIVIRVFTQDNSAQESSDYIFQPTELTFKASDNVQIQSISIEIVDDTLIELPENFYVKFKVISNQSPSLLELQNFFTVIIISDDVLGANIQGRPLIDHDIIYFEDIGTNYSTGLTCNGIVSDICCSDFEEPLTLKEINGSEPNGNGSWIYPSGKYVRRPCGTCEDVMIETFSIFRTENATILYRNENATNNVSGIYRCEIPLAITVPHFYYIGIAGKSNGVTLKLKQNLTYLNFPNSILLHYQTIGAPVAKTEWILNGEEIKTGENVVESKVVLDYVHVVYKISLNITNAGDGTVFGQYTVIAAVANNISSVSASIEVKDICDGNFICSGNMTANIPDDTCDMEEEENCTFKKQICIRENDMAICTCEQGSVEIFDRCYSTVLVAWGTAAAFMGFLIMLTSIVASVICYFHRKKESTREIFVIHQKTRKAKSFEDEMTKSYVHDPLVESLPKKLFIPRSTLEIGESIGQGEFGIVYKAHLMKDFSLRVTNTVAVKTLKGFHDDDLINEMLKECVKMLDFNHPNVLTLLGVCVDGGPAPYIVMPFMANGSLLTHLKRYRHEFLLPIDHTDSDEVKETMMKLMDMCIQVAKGMEYLSSKKLIHRDLAARNCMIDTNYIIKVADFGLSVNLGAKDYFRQNEKGGVKLPIKWMAMECLTDSVFSEKSDVWSFGVTCWEVFNGGKTPHATIHPMNLLQLLEEGYRMEKPLNASCTDEMYCIMCQCWKRNPQDRPTFSNLIHTLSHSLGSKAGYLDIGAFIDQSSRYLPTGARTLSVSDRMLVCSEEIDPIGRRRLGTSSWSLHSLHILRQSNQNIYISSP